MPLKYIFMEYIKNIYGCWIDSIGSKGLALNAVNPDSNLCCSLITKTGTKPECPWTPKKER